MSPESVIWLDGELTSVLPLPDRGLDFGDGLFETLLVQHGRPLFTELHMERLERGIQALEMPDCLDTARQRLDCAARYIVIGGWPWTALRLSVLRGSGERGYSPTRSSPPRILVVATRLDHDCAQIFPAATLSLAKIRLSAQPLLAGIKHLNRLEQVLAAAQAQHEGADECLVLDQSGLPTSVIAGNLFLLREGELLTPELSHCGVKGIRRRLIIEKWGPALGLKVREGKLTMEDLKESEEVFYSNSLKTVCPIGSIDNLSWKKSTVCQALFKKFLEDLM